MSLTISNVDAMVAMGVGDSNEWADVENQLAAMLPGVDSDSLNSAIRQYVAANPTATPAEVLEAVVTQLNPDITSDEVAALRSEWEEFAQTTNLAPADLMAILGPETVSVEGMSARDLMAMALLMIIEVLGEEAANEMLAGFDERDALMELAHQKADEITAKAWISFACSMTSAVISVVGGAVSLGMTMKSTPSSKADADAPDSLGTGTGTTTPTTQTQSQPQVDAPDDLGLDDVAPKTTTQPGTTVDGPTTQVDAPDDAPDTQAPKTTAPDTSSQGTTQPSDAPDDAPDTQAPKSPTTETKGSTQGTDAPDDAPDTDAPGTTDGKTPGSGGTDGKKPSESAMAKATKIQTLVMAMNQFTQGAAGVFSSGGQLGAGLMDAQIALTDGEMSVTQSMLSHHQEMQKLAEEVMAAMIEVFNSLKNQQYQTFQQISRI
ncbi:hypothetical protein [Desulfocurvus sp. DL9XJH121]